MLCMNLSINQIGGGKDSGGGARAPLMDEYIYRRSGQSKPRCVCPPPPEKRELQVLAIASAGVDGWGDLDSRTPE